MNFDYINARVYNQLQLKRLAIALSILAALDRNQVDENMITHILSKLYDADGIISELDINTIQWEKLKNIIAKNDFKQNNRFSEELKALINDLFKSLQPSIKELKLDHRVSNELVNIMSSSKSSINGNDNAYANLQKTVGILNDPIVSRMYRHNVTQSQSTHLKELAKIVSQLGNTYQYDLTREEMTKAKEEFPNLYQRFLRLRASIRDISKYSIRNISRDLQAEGKTGLVPTAKMKKLLKQEGVSVHSIPKGFKGKIDSEGKLYTSKGKSLRPQPPPSCIVKMNDKYNPSTDETYYCAAYTPSASKPTYIYTDKWWGKSQLSKFEKVNKFLDKIPTYRRKWLKEISRVGFDDGFKDKKDITSKNLQCAIILEIIYQTSARIGGKDNATKVEGEATSTFGVSTLRGRHVEIKGSRLIISYPGKKHIFQTHTIKKKQQADKLIDIVLYLKKFHGEDNYLFQRPDGKPISGKLVNRYLKSLGAKQATVHMFRHAKGSSLMRESLQEHPWKTTPASSTSQVTKWIKEQAKAVAKELGHDPSQTMKSYTHPDITEKVYIEARVPVPKEFQKLRGYDPSNLSDHLDYVKELEKRNR